MTSVFTTKLDEILTNPSAIQRYTLRFLREILNGEVDFIDPSNPMVALMECSAHHTAAAVMNFEVNGRRMFPSVAVDELDIYRHMSDKDYIDRFTLPSRATFKFVFRVSELMNRMVYRPGDPTGRVVLPRDTQVEVGGIPFTFAYPVEIRKLEHGGLTVVYLADKPNPILELETNVIEPEYSSDMNDEYVQIAIETIQTRIVTASDTIRATSANAVTKSLTDDFYYARVYNEQDDGTWVELATTHNDQIYDPKTPTAVITVLDRTVRVTIPQIYTQSQDVVGKVRVDIYETKGPIHVDLGSYDISQYKVNWNIIDSNDRIPETTVLSQFTVVQCYSDTLVYGGRAKIDLDELRKRVVMNTTGPKNRPITPDEIQTALVDLGYDIVKNIDNITNRVFLASKELPTPSQPQLITAAALSIQSSVFSVDQAVDTGTVIDNRSSITITPDTIFQNVGGRTHLVPKLEVERIKALPLDEQAFIIGRNYYYFTPFHYVLDFKSDEFDARAYYLDAPTAHSKLFIAENASTHMSCYTASYELKLDNGNYVLDVLTKSNDTFKDLEDRNVYVQLSFKPQGESYYAYLNGYLVNVTDDGERMFRFDLTTNYYVGELNGLELTGFKMFDQESRRLKTELYQEFDLVYMYDGYKPRDWHPNDVDDQIGRMYVPDGVAGVMRERLRLEFGKTLDHLWKRARNIVAEMNFERYAVDIPARYNADVYELNPDNDSPVWVIDGKVTFKRLHKKGDIKYNEDDTPVILYHAGETVRDENGNPVPISARAVQIQMDFMLVDGTYWFSNDPVAASYITELTDLLVSWITHDLNEIQPSLLEQTRIYFYPKTTTGLIDVMYGPGLITSIEAGQSLSMDLHVKETVYSNELLKRQIKEKSIRVINEQFRHRVVSVSDITVALKLTLGQDVIDVLVYDLGGGPNYPVITILEDTDRCSLRKKLIDRPDGKLIVEEDLTINWIKHQPE